MQCFRLSEVCSFLGREAEAAMLDRDAVLGREAAVVDVIGTSAPTGRAAASSTGKMTAEAVGRIVGDHGAVIGTADGHAAETQGHASVIEADRKEQRQGTLRGRMRERRAASEMSEREAAAEVPSGARIVGIASALDRKTPSLSLPCVLLASDDSLTETIPNCKGNHVVWSRRDVSRDAVQAVKCSAAVEWPATSSMVLSGVGECAT